MKKIIPTNIFQFFPKPIIQIKSKLTNHNKISWAVLIFIVIALSGAFILNAYVAPIIQIMNSKSSVDKMQPKNESINKGQSLSKNPSETNRKNTLGSKNCDFKDWSIFSKSDWSNTSWFSISDNVWSLPFEKGIRDATLYYNVACSGNTLIEYEVIPRLNEYINLDIFLRGQLRWEIGGNDRRSIRLYKNTVGCSSGEIKKVVMPSLLSEYLPNHDEILINHPLIVHMATYYLENGLIRNEVWLTYSSKNMGGATLITPRGKYFYDFEVSSICDALHLPDINLEAYQFGIGLQRSSSVLSNQMSNLPRITFNKYKISPFSFTE